MLSKLTTQIALRKAGLGGVKIPDPFSASESKSSKGSQDSEGGGFANPFANVKWGAPKAFASWTSPPPTQSPVQPIPVAGDKAKSATKLRFPAVDGRPCVVLFLRYCGCPCTLQLLDDSAFAKLIQCSYREALPSSSIASEQTHLNTLRRRITLHPSRHQ
jgi:hypothetical protein